MWMWMCWRVGVGWLPWAAADSSHRLYPKGWSHTDRATYAVWWGWSGWCGDVAAPVNTDGLAARAGLRPSTLRRRPHPAGLWNHRGDRLAVARWEDPYLDAHREQVRYNDYRCSVPTRSGLEGATVRWHGHTNQPEPDTAPPSVNEPPDAGQLWGGLIAYKPSYTTSARKKPSGARPSGDAPKKQISAKQGIAGRGPPIRRRQRWTAERRNYETRATSGSWVGPVRGQDPQTKIVTEKTRNENFARLLAAQEHVLNLTNWHSYIVSVKRAGYRSSEMLTSANNFLYCYIVFLIGRHEYGVGQSELREAVARWFFMASLTGRYTGSPETILEADLRRFSEAQSAD